MPRDGSLDRKVVFEPLEPRYLLSADLMPLLVDLSQFDDQTATLHVLDDTNQNKVLHAAGFKNQAAYEVYQNLADTNGVVVSGTDGDDQLIVDFSDAFSLQDGIRFAGGLGLDRLTIGNGILNSVSYFAHGGEAGSLELDDGLLTSSIVFAGVDSIADQAQAAQRHFANESGLSQSIHLSDGGDSADDTLKLESATGGFSSYEFTIPTISFFLVAGDLGDTFVLESVDTGITTTISLTGGAGDDTLVGFDSTATWTLTGADAGTLESDASVAFAGFENLSGGSGADQFVFAGGSLSGHISGGGGTDAIDYSSYLTGVSIDLGLGDATDTGGISDLENVTGGAGADTLLGDAGDNILSGGAGDDSFSGGGGLDVVYGGEGLDTLIGGDGTNIWQITGVNSGTVNDLIFFDVENLVGGAGDDTFIFAAGGRVDGTIDGGAGINTLDYSAQSEAIAVDLSSGAATRTAGVQLIQNVRGSSGDDTLIGDAGENVLIGNGGDDLLRGGGGVDFFAGGAGNDTLLGEDVGNLWAIAGANSGVLNGLRFVDTENLLGGSDDDIFALLTEGSLSGEIDGGGGTNTLDYKAISSGIAVSLLHGLAFSTAGVRNIRNVRGGSGDDTLEGDDEANTLFGGEGDDTLVGNGGDDVLSGGLGFDSFSGGVGEDTLLGHLTETAWDVSGDNTGTLNGQIFVDFENLVGAAGNEDVFVINSGGKLDGLIEGGEGGFDSLNIGGEYQSLVSTATGPSSGVFELDGSIIRYTGLEPVELPNTPPKTIIFNFDQKADTNDKAELVFNQQILNTQKFTLRALVGNTPATFEQPTFTIDKDTTVTINLLQGNDTLSIKGVAGGLLGTWTINGGSGSDTIIAYSVPPPVGGIQLTNTAITLDNQDTYSLNSFEAAILNGLAPEQISADAFTFPVLTNLSDWTSQGPGPIVGGQVINIQQGFLNGPVTGAIQVIAPHPTRADIVFVGTAGGGIWGTKNYTAIPSDITWTPFTDQLPSLSITAMAFSPDGSTIYAGTGRVSSSYMGGESVGLLRSVLDANHDGIISDEEFQNQTWEVVGKSFFSNGRKITNIIATESALFVTTALNSPVEKLTRITDPQGVLAVSGVNIIHVADPTLFKQGDTLNFFDLQGTKTESATILNIIPQDKAIVFAANLNNDHEANSYVGLASALLDFGGVFRSTNGGQTFVNLSRQPGTNLHPGSVTDLVVDPTNSNLLYVAIPGQGIFKTTDGGDVWNAIDSGIINTPVRGFVRSEDTVSVKLAISQAKINPTSNVHPLYVGVIQLPVTTLAAAVTPTAGNPVKSFEVTDHTLFEVGDRVTFFDTNGKQTETDEIAGIFGPTKLITLKVGLTQPGAVYMKGTDVQRLLGLFRSENEGSSFLPMSLPKDASGQGIHVGGQGDIHFSMLADRSLPNVLYVGGDRDPTTGAGRLLKFSSGSWTPLTNSVVGAPHADSRTMVFDNNFDILQADDGGIYRLPLATDGATARWQSINGNLTLTEFYSVAWDYVNNRILGGAQDNGTVLQNASGSLQWPLQRGGDGAIVFADGNKYFYSSQELGGFPSTFDPATFDFSRLSGFFAFGKTDESGNAVPLTYGELRPTGVPFGTTAKPIPGDSTVQFINPYAVNSTNSNRLLIGTNFLYEVTKVNNTISSKQLVDSSSGTKYDFGQITSIVFGGKSSDPKWTSAGLEGVGFVGTMGQPETKHVLFVHPADKSTTPFLAVTSFTNTVKSAIREIAIDPTDWTKVYVLTVDGKVWFNTNGYQAAKAPPGDPNNWGWTNITSNLHALDGTHLLQSLEVANIDGTPVILAGGAGGVYRKIGNSGLWSEFGNGLPNALVTDIDYHAAADVLLVGTLGRGAWTLNNASTTLGQRTELTIRGSEASDIIEIGRNAAKPWLLDVYVNKTTANSSPTFSAPLANIEKIIIDGKGLNDTVRVDTSNGPITADLIDIKGGAGSNTLEIKYVELTA